MASQTPQRKLVVFVGGSSGIGFAALEDLLATGTSYHVVLGSRAPLEPWRYGQLQPSLQSSGSTFDRLQVDLQRYDSVKRFVEEVKSKYAGPISALVLCAGKIAGHHRETADGEDETLQVNVLAQALLMDLLEPKLGSQTVPCRVLMVGSGLHRSILEKTVDPGNVSVLLTVKYDPMQAYEISKLLQIFLLYMAQERFGAEKRNVTVVVASPGFVPDSGLSRELGIIKRGISRWVLPWIPIATTMEDAGRTVCRGITQNFANGTYFSSSKIEETAEETYDPRLREEWRQWFVAKGVWHAEGPVTVAQSQQPLPKDETEPM